MFFALGMLVGAFFWYKANGPGNKEERYSERTFWGTLFFIIIIGGGIYSLTYYIVSH